MRCCSAKRDICRCISGFPTFRFYPCRDDLSGFRFRVRGHGSNGFFHGSVMVAINALDSFGCVARMWGLYDLKCFFVVKKSSGDSEFGAIWDQPSEKF